MTAERVKAIFKEASNTTISTTQKVTATVTSKAQSVSATATATATVNKVQHIASATTASVQNLANATQPKMQMFADNLSNILPTRRYALPDRSVASQILMYRQLLHTECKPGLRLSRSYEATDAQMKVKHMPWWELGIESTQKMTISYDNLIVRLWLGGAIMPYVDGGYAVAHKSKSVMKDYKQGNDLKEKEQITPDGSMKSDVNQNTEIQLGEQTRTSHVDTLIDLKGLPPIPHNYWVDRLGFQQTDPVTDFRSGGVLSLALMAHIVEACPNVHARFLPSGDTHMLPFGITCINVTNMIAKACMFSKKVERLDVLMSQKPFWKMFENPDSLLVLKELSMENLCNVVVEIGRERKIDVMDSDEENMTSKEVTVFDFSEILAKTEKRVVNDLLGAGPRNVDELRVFAARNHAKYLRAMERKEQMAMRVTERKEEQAKRATERSTPQTALPYQKENITYPMKGMADNVFGTASGVFSKFKSFGSPKTQQKKSTVGEILEEVDFAAAPKQSIKSSGEPLIEVEEKTALQEAHDLLDFVDEDLDSKTEQARKEFADLLDDSTRHTEDYFTIDEEDFL